MFQAECCLYALVFYWWGDWGLEKLNDWQKVVQWWSENLILSHLTQQWALLAILCSQSGLYTLCIHRNQWLMGAGEAHISVWVDDFKLGFEAWLGVQYLEKKKIFQVEGTAYVKHVGMFLICLLLPLALPTYTPFFLEMADISHPHSLMLFLSGKGLEFHIISL